MMVAGIGCRAGASAQEIEGALMAALEQAGVETPLRAIATSATKAVEAGIAAVARARGVDLIALPQAALEAVAARALTHSPRVQAVAGVPSVAETAALAAAGPGARLLAPRLALGPVTCALATGEDVS
ncbi:MAG: cobalamin biosynthesis protein [Pseudolabrys sp.]